MGLLTCLLQLVQLVCMTLCLPSAEDVEGSGLVRRDLSTSESTGERLFLAHVSRRRRHQGN